MIYIAGFDLSVPAQNLVTNGNFETYTQLPNYYAQSCYATGWNSPSGSCNLIVGQGSPDYYHLWGSSGAQPPNTWWADVMPYAGNAMEGFAGYYNSSGTSYREYIQYQLSSPMIPGTVYEVSYFLTNGITSIHGYGCNHIGAYFSTTPITQAGGAPIPVVPHVEDPGVFFSNTWQKKTFTFIATAPYTFVTIGNFYNNANTTIVQFVFPSTLVAAYYYIDDVIVQAVSPLPVGLISFSGEHRDQLNYLEWSTATEINNDHFDVERSPDGINFDKVGDVAGSGNSNQVIHYFFTDENYNEGINYYRLKQWDTNGDFINSHIIAIDNKNARENCTLIVTGKNEILLPKCPAKEGILRIFDLGGRLIKELQAGKTQSSEIDLSGLEDGIYLLQYSDGVHYQNIKFLKTGDRN